MKKLIKLKLETILYFQKNYPTSHVGGSIGLFLRGVNLQRDLDKSDLDITVDEYIETKEMNLHERSDANDFDYCLEKNHEGGCYTKIDIRVSPEPSFDVIEFEGEKYNVSKLRDILFWKKKYADKGVKKHQDDLITIKTGLRPLDCKEYNLDELGDLPF